MTTVYALIISQVGDPSVVTDIPSLVAYIAACVTFTLFVFTIPYVIIVIGQFFKRS